MAGIIDGINILSAAEKGDIESVRSWLEKGGKINEIKDKSGFSALSQACSMGHHETVELLLEYGADVYSKDNVGNSALFMACSMGHHETVELLLEYGADVYSKDNGGYSALSQACSMGHHETVELLLEYGADVYSKSNYGKTALDYANNEDIRNLLLSHKKDGGLRGLLGDAADIRRGELYGKVRSAVEEQSRELRSAGNIDSLIANLGRVVGLQSDSDTISREQYLFRVSMALPAGAGSSVMDDLGAIHSALLDAAKTAALEEGSLEYGVSQLMVVGEGAAGKSSLIRSLTGRPFKLEWDSTVGVNKEDFAAVHDPALLHEAGRDVAVVSTAAEWRPIDKKGANEMDRAAAHNASRSKSEGLPNQLRDRYVKIRLSAAHVPNHPDSGSPEDVKAVPADPPAASGASPDIDTANAPAVRPAASESSSAPDTATERAARLGQLSFSSADNVTFIVNDFGGQRAFQPLQQMLLSRYGVYAIVFDMSKLSSTEDTVRNSAMEYIKYWFQQIEMLALGAPIFLIGTRAGSFNEEARIKIDASLKNVLSKLSCWESVNHNDALSFFHVENSDPNDENIKKLRTAFPDAAKNDDCKYLTDRVPTSWVNVCDEMKKLSSSGTQYMKTRTGGGVTVKQLARDCGVFSGDNQDEDITLSSMLDLFHKLGVFLYFDDDSLRNYVILDPQWLIDNIVCIIRDLHLHPLYRDRKLKQCVEKWKEFAFKGILADSMLDVMWEGEKSNKEFLVSMLKMLLLVCELPPRKLPDGSSSKETCYIVPSVLQQADGEADHIWPHLDDRCFSGKFELSFAPYLPGTYYPRLIIALVQLSAEYVPFSMTVKSGAGDETVRVSGEAPCIFSYQGVYTAALAIASHAVLLSQHDNSIFAYVCRSDKPIHVKAIEKSIKDAIHQLSAELMYPHLCVETNFVSHGQAPTIVCRESSEFVVSSISSANSSLESQLNLYRRNLKNKAYVSSCLSDNPLATAFTNEMVEHRFNFPEIKDKMKAIDASDIFVACISKEYVNSEDCMNEFRYACFRAVNNKIIMIFVMLNCDFTPDSALPVKSVILNNLEPDLKWFGLYDQANVSDIVKDISAYILSLRQNQDIPCEFLLNRSAEAAAEQVPPDYVAVGDEVYIDIFRKWLREPPPGLVKDAGRRDMAARHFATVYGYESVEDMKTSVRVSGLTIDRLEKEVKLNLAEASKVYNALDDSNRSVSESKQMFARFASSKQRQVMTLQNQAKLLKKVDAIECNTKIIIGQQDKTMRMIEQVNNKLDSLLIGFNDIPTLLIVVPKKPKSRCQYLLNPPSWLYTEYQVFFVCSKTFRAIPWKGDRDGKGSLLKQPRSWVKKAAPYIKLGLLVARIVVLVSTGIPLPIAPIMELIPSTNYTKEIGLKFFDDCAVSLQIEDEALKFGDPSDIAVEIDQEVSNIRSDETAEVIDNLGAGLVADIDKTIAKLKSSMNEKNKQGAHDAILSAFRAQGITENDIRTGSGLAKVATNTGGVIWVDSTLVDNNLNFIPSTVDAPPCSSDNVNEQIVNTKDDYEDLNV